MDEKGETALHAAVRHNQSHVVQALLQGGADHSILNYEQMAPLHLACDLGHVDSLRVSRFNIFNILFCNFDAFPLHPPTPPSCFLLLSLLFVCFSFFLLCVCVCVCVFIVKRPVLPPYAVDGRSRTAVYYYFKKKSLRVRFCLYASG